jgi:glycolate oxidase FAD binding subunit
MFTEEKKNSQTSQDSDNVYKPANEIETSNFIKEIYKKNLPTEIVGANTKNFIGNKLQCAKVLDLSRLSGIMEYLPEELYIKVKACTPISLIEESLEKNNQQLAFEPIDFGYLKDSKPNKGTAAGQLSCNFSGSRRFKVGSLRDHILGFRGVNGKGDIIKSGGTVVKNVTGYDLSKLVTGSFGTLTALTEITFKVLPKKDSISTLVIYSEDNKIISDLFDQLLSSSNEISGAVYIPVEPNNKNYTKNIEKIFKFNNLKSEEPFVAVRIEGSKKSIDERIQDISQELQTNKMKTSILDFYQSKLFWEKINNLELFSGTKNNLLRAVIPTATSLDLMKYLKNNFKYYIDWCGSLFWIEVLEKENIQIKEMKETIINLGGYLTIVKKSESLSSDIDIFTINDTRLLLSQKIKESFDPKKLLNPGKMYRSL